MDLRIERTYRSLVSAFTRLLEERPYEETSRRVRNQIVTIRIKEQQ